MCSDEENIWLSHLSSTGHMLGNGSSLPWTYCVPFEANLYLKLYLEYSLSLPHLGDGVGAVGVVDAGLGDGVGAGLGVVDAGLGDGVDAGLGDAVGAGLVDAGLGDGIGTGLGVVDAGLGDSVDAGLGDAVGAGLVDGGLGDGIGAGLGVVDDGLGDGVGNGGKVLWHNRSGRSAAISGRWCLDGLSFMIHTASL